MDKRKRPAALLPVLQGVLFDEENDVPHCENSIPYLARKNQPSNARLKFHFDSLINQASLFMTRANAAGDPDRWTLHFTIYCSLVAKKWDAPYSRPEVTR